MNLMPIETVKKLRDAWERGLSTRAAARSVAVNRNTCAKYFRMWASDGATVDPLRREDRGSIADAETMCMECIISPDLKSQLIQAAVARKTSLNHFVGFLLEIIVEENLIPAILDENGDADIPEPMPTKRNCLCCGAGFSAPTDSTGFAGSVPPLARKAPAILRLIMCPMRRLSSRAAWAVLSEDDPRHHHDDRQPGRARRGLTGNWYPALNHPERNP